MSPALASRASINGFYNLLKVLPRPLIEKVSAEYVRALSYRDLCWFTLWCWLPALTVNVFLRLGLRRILHTIEVNAIEKLLAGRAVKVEIQLEQRLQLQHVMQNSSVSLHDQICFGTRAKWTSSA